MNAHPNSLPGHERRQSSWLAEKSLFFLEHWWHNADPAAALAEVKRRATTHHPDRLAAIKLLQRLNNGEKNVSDY